MDKLLGKILFIGLLLPQVAFADNMSMSIEHGYATAQDKITKDEARLSFNYNSPKYWIDESFGWNKSSGIDKENFLGGGPKYKLSDNFKLSLGLLWRYTETGSDYLFSGRVKYRIHRFKLIGNYQPYLNKDEYILNGKIVFNPGDIIEFSESVNYRSEGDIFDNTFGIGYKF